jgi:hypothetical protein
MMETQWMGMGMDYDRPLDAIQNVNFNLISIATQLELRARQKQ